MKRLRRLAATGSLRSLVGAVVAAILVLLAVAGAKSYRDLGAARAREAELEARIEETRTRVVELRGRIERLREDAATLERLAREEGMIYPGDVVLVLSGADEVHPAN